MNGSTRVKKREYKDIEFKIIKPKDHSKNKELIGMFYKHALTAGMQPIAPEDQRFVTYLIALEKGIYLEGACIREKGAWQRMKKLDKSQLVFPGFHLLWEGLPPEALRWFFAGKS